MTILHTTHQLYCTNCFTEKRIFLSTTDQEKESFKNHHSSCNPHPSLVKEDSRFALQDWKERTGQKI